MQVFFLNPVKFMKVFDLIIYFRLDLVNLLRGSVLLLTGGGLVGCVVEMAAIWAYKSH